MSEKSDLLMALIPLLMKSTGQPGGVDIQQNATSAPPTGFGMKPAESVGNTPAHDAMPMQGAESANAPASHGMPGAVIRKTPLQPFSWEAEEKISYVPEKYGPIREEQPAVPPSNGWPVYRGFGKQFSRPRYGGAVSEKRYSYPQYGGQGARAEKQFSVPQYGWRSGGNGQRYSRMGNTFAEGEGDGAADTHLPLRGIQKAPYRHSSCAYAYPSWPWRR